ncbi:MAG: VPLPA-CTERM sorting domain-containing protein, partial [Gammaproteobacteria bacterium]|nr:VPLPA-CTERM sorting domain-containing protein [Gammaproteobacteria bacterium]
FNVTYDSVTGEISQVNSMVLNMPDAVLTIAGATVVTVTQGNGVPTANDTLFIESGTGAPNGTADADQIRALIGSGTGLFEHDDAPNTDAPDFATFADIVDSCVGPNCPLIPLLSLDGVRYRLLGTVNGLGGDTLQLQTQTANNSIYKVNFTTAVVPVPAAVWLFGSALGLLGWIRSRARA